MNTETEKNINDAIDWLQQTGQSVQSFAIEQAPLYCRELIEWKIHLGIYAAFYLVFASIVALLLGRYCLKAADEGDGGPAIASMLVGLFLAVSAIVATPRVICEGFKAYHAPRVVILEHLKEITQ